MTSRLILNTAMLHFPDRTTRYAALALASLGSPTNAQGTAGRTVTHAATVRLRMGRWCDLAGLSVNDVAFAIGTLHDRGYIARWRRRSNGGFEVELDTTTLPLRITDHDAPERIDTGTQQEWPTHRYGGAA